MGQAFEDGSLNKEGQALGNRPCISATWVGTSVPPPQSGPELMVKGSRRPIWPSRNAAFFGMDGSKRERNC